MTPDRLRKAREKLQLSQQNIAKELEICKRYWIYRESGEKPIPRWLARAVRDLVKYPKNRP